MKHDFICRKCRKRRTVEIPAYQCDGCEEFDTLEPNTSGPFTAPQLTRHDFFAAQVVRAYIAKQGLPKIAEEREALALEAKRVADELIRNAPLVAYDIG